MPPTALEKKPGGRAGRTLALALAAGLALALMEAAQVLAQPGAAIASARDIITLVTWLALPYALALGAAGIAGASALSVMARRCPWEAAFAGTAAAAGLLVWIRRLLQLRTAAPTYEVLELLVGGAAVAAGAACAVLVARRLEGDGRRGAAWAVGGLSALAVLVVESRGSRDLLGRALPPPALPIRLGLAVAAGVIVGLIVIKSSHLLDQLGRPARPAARARLAMRWLGRATFAAVAAWVAFTAYDFAGLLSRKPEVMEGWAEAIGAGSSRAAQASEPVSPAASTRPNVLLVSIDTLRADHLSCYGYDKRTSPHMDRLASEGVRFARTASTASFTLPSHASMMTGLFPTSHGATYQNRDSRRFTVSGMGTGYPTLAEILRDAGYDTAGFASGPLMSHDFGFARGFMIYDDRYDRLQTARARLFARTILFEGLSRAGVFTSRDLDSQRIAAEVTPLIESWLSEREQRQKAGVPFFIFAHYWDPHGPYDPPEFQIRGVDGSQLAAEYDMDRLLTGRYTLSEQALADTLALYDAEIQYVDQHIGRLIDGLRQRGLLDETLVILTSDHGESFGEHDHWEHSRVLYEDLLHVPFIVRLPGGAAAGTVVSDAIAQPTDILPTVLPLLGLNLPEGIEGRDLRRFMVPVGDGAAEGTAGGESARSGVRAPGLAFAELDRNLDWPKTWGARFDRDLTSARTLRWKYIQASTGQEELYDLEADPRELVNLASGDPEGTATMRALTEAWRKSLGAREGEGGPGGIDEGLLENLRSLGYVQ